MQHGNSDENVMAHLIASGIDVNAANSDGFTLAHRAARVNKNENVLAMLIAAGADLRLATSAAAQFAILPRRIQTPP
jgi:ankyrin repeat protein